MTNDELNKLVAHIDHLLSQYLELRQERATGKIIRGEDIDVDKLMEEGLYPPDDPTSATRLALLSIGETLGRVGGEELMHRVHSAYEARYGHRKAVSLSARWDSAADLWFY